MADANLQVDLAPPAALDAVRWRAACRAVLGLDAADADRLRQSAPVTLQLALGGEAQAWVVRLERDLGARVVPSRLAGAERCAAHPRARVSERCTACGEVRACALCRYASAAGTCATCTASRRRARTFRNARIAVLLAVLAVVAVGTASTRRRLHAWVAPLSVEVVPVAADPDGAEYARALSPSAFAAVGRFLTAEGKRYGREGLQLDVHTAPAIDEAPPEPPPAGSSVLAIVIWSLKLRAWDWQTARNAHLAPADVRIYVLYHRASAGQELDASVGLEQGHVGIVQAPVGEPNHGWVQLAVTHELLHTLGATDKYDSEGQPRIPEGLGDPDQDPTFPQARCEVMAGRVVLDTDRAPLARALEQCAVNRFTAGEIGWLSARK